MDFWSRFYAEKLCMNRLDCSLIGYQFIEHCPRFFHFEKINKFQRITLKSIYEEPRERFFGFEIDQQRYIQYSPIYYKGLF